MVLTRDQILALIDFEIRKVSVPEWNGDGHVFIRSITARQRDEFESSVNDGKRTDLNNMRARLVVLCLCDEHGKLLFDDPVEGAKALGQRRADVMDRLFDECRTLNGMTQDDVEELAKN